MKKCFRAVVWALAVVCAAGLYAQDYRARVQGVVTDASQAAVIGAKVTLLNENTGVDVVRTTGENGRYLFDFVEPGVYTLTVESAGFAKSVQQNVQVQVRGDITVNAALSVGAVSETINVAESAVALQFNTSTMELTVDRKMLNELPIMQRNPFTLALLDPAVVNRYWDIAHRNPFYMWSSSQLDVGGSTMMKNDLLLDGAPIQIGVKGSYSPPMDAVQEFSVQQNSVDAEFGHSAGGIMSIGIKSGTNEFHGSAYYFGRNPALNAQTNSVLHTPNLVRNHIWGGTVGNPIIKNRLFTFTAYEGWRSQEPNQTIRTMPTDLERTGDFSRSLNIKGGLRTIYDPWTTQFDPASGAVNRTPFAGNIIPASRFDPSSVRFLQDIWKPNNPGDDITGVNNYKIGYSWPQKYWNFTERVDWNIRDNWKVFFRYSRVRTDLDQTQYVNSPAMPNDNGGLMNNRNIAGDMVYTLNPTTVINFRMGFASLEDDYNAPRSIIGESGLAQFWPSNAWYKPYIGEMPAVYYPNLNLGGASYGKGSYWYQHPRHWTFEGSIHKSLGIHSLKAGFDHRRHRADGIFPNLMNFYFYPATTAETFLSPDIKSNGSDWASFLLGALDNNSVARTYPFQYFGNNYTAAFVQDDIKLTRNITLNMGLRYEYNTPPFDAQNRISRGADLTVPIQAFQNNPPVFPDAVTQVMQSKPILNGAWRFTDSSHPGAYDSDRFIFEPRIGVAIRINDKTAFRAGYARYVIPLDTLQTTLDTSLPTFGYSATTFVSPLLNGVPAARLSDPFPSTNPLILPAGKSRGVNSNLGDNVYWYNQNQHPGVNDRFNFSIQRQLPNEVHFDATFFMNFGHNLPYDRNIDLADPNIQYSIKGVWDQQVANPFYQYGTPDQFPGALRNQKTVTVGSLLTPYPQYAGLTQRATDGVLNRYKAIQLRVQRAFKSGYSFLVAYNYNYEQTYDFFNPINQFNQKLSFIDSYWPRHRITVAGSYDFPFGKGRKYLSNMHPVLNAIIGGWQTSHLLLVNSGQFLRFAQMITDGSNPDIDNKTRDRWFDTSKFARPLPYTSRTNPWQYPGVVGPKYWNLDSTLSKVFPIKEKFNLEFRFEAYNLTNSFVPSLPDMSVTSSTFGRSTSQMNRGREMQYSLRLMF